VGSHWSSHTTLLRACTLPSWVLITPKPSPCCLASLCYFCFIPQCMLRTQARDLHPILCSSLCTTPSLCQCCPFPDQNELPFEELCCLFCSCLLLVFSIMCESHWVLAVHSILRVSQREFPSFISLLFPI
jgi:hypothetical protein